MANFNPISLSDAARRPYCLSLDWLQLFCWRTEFFVADGTNSWGYTTKLLDHGSKYWKHIYDVFDPEGILIGQVTTDPHKPEVAQNSAMFKADNSLLYEAEPVDRISAAILCLGLVVKSVARLDIAYDCNEFYNGLHPATLVWGYLHGKYVKVGQNRWLLYGESGYYGTDSNGSFVALDAEPKRVGSSSKVAAKRAEELEQRRLDCLAAGMPFEEPRQPRVLERIPGFKVGSLTWGMRSNSVQVQLYDKSRELREVKMKHHIVKSWKLAGLDVTKTVYRLELRITSRGKTLQNMSTSQFFSLGVNDILCQQLIEQVFFDYCEKYFKFYLVDGHQKIQNSKRLRLLSLTNQAVLRPKNSEFSKDYTRGTIIALHTLDKHIVENKRVDNGIASSLMEVRNYLEEAHKLHEHESRWMSQQINMMRVEKGLLTELSPEEYYNLRLKGAPDALISIAANARKILEASIAKQQELLQERLQEHLDNGGTADSWRAMRAVRALEIPDYFVTALSPLLPTTPSLDELIGGCEVASGQGSLIEAVASTPPPPPLTAELLARVEERQKKLQREAYDPVHDLLFPVDDCPF